jgi:hypothetical protein
MMRALIGILCIISAAVAPCSAQTVIFRFDDVQDYYLVPEQISVIDLFMSKGVPLSMVVIGGNYFGNDPNIVIKVTEAYNRGNEVVNHGDDASTYFNEIPTNEAKTHILDGQVSTCVPYVSFVPPCLFRTKIGGQSQHWPLYVN